MSRIPFPDIVIRPGTHLDTHLSSQPFSRCTVPLVCPASMHILIAICTMQCSCYGWQESGHNLIIPSGHQSSKMQDSKPFSGCVWNGQRSDLTSYACAGHGDELGDHLW